MKRDLSPATGISTRKLIKMDTKSKELNQVLLKKHQKLILRMIKLSKLSHLISHLIISSVSIRVKLRLKPQGNILSALLQMMDLDFGLMKRELLITGVFMVPRKEKVEFISKLDIMISEPFISKTKEVLQ